MNREGVINFTALVNAATTVVEARSAGLTIPALHAHAPLGAAQAKLKTAADGVIAYPAVTADMQEWLDAQFAVLKSEAEAALVSGACPRRVKHEWEASVAALVAIAKATEDAT